MKSLVPDGTCSWWEELGRSRPFSKRQALIALLYVKYRCYILPYNRWKRQQQLSHLQSSQNAAAHLLRVEDQGTCRRRHRRDHWHHSCEKESSHNATECDGFCVGANHAVIAAVRTRGRLKIYSRVQQSLGLPCKTKGASFASISGLSMYAELPFNLPYMVDGELQRSRETLNNFLLLLYSYCCARTCA